MLRGQSGPLITLEMLAVSTTQSVALTHSSAHSQLSTNKISASNEEEPKFQNAISPFLALDSACISLLKMLLLMLTNFFNYSIVYYKL